METILSSASRQAVFPIAESSQIAAARRSGSALARNLGFDDTAAGKVAIVITEAATNIVKHAVHGEILIRPLQSGNAVGIEIVAIDAGPGMSSLASNMRDGMSTAGSYGVGLGAMQRLADEFDIYTGLGNGTVLCAALWSAPDVTHASPWQTGVVCLPLPGEDVCGDAWAVSADPTVATVMVADGLGHGPDAARASEAAAATLAQHPDLPPGETLRVAHGALRATRGAAVATARVDTIAEEMHFAGVGNIAASILDGNDRRQMVSHNGIVGSNLRKVQEFVSPWSSGAMLIMHSDGLGSRWDLEHYPGLAMRHPSLIAAVLYRDFARKRDDVTVLVVRENLDSRP
jgi:anti-sigma regulatory factor (Ser/Thr protein kinase)